MSNAKVKSIALSVAMSAGVLVYAIHVFVTRVSFTADGFVAHRVWRGTLREPYDGVVSISGKPATITIHFADGKAIRLHSGMGDPDIVVAILRARCPRSVRLRVDREDL